MRKLPYPDKQNRSLLILVMLILTPVLLSKQRTVVLDAIKFNSHGVIPIQTRTKRLCKYDSLTQGPRACMPLAYTRPAIGMPKEGGALNSFGSVSTPVHTMKKLETLNPKHKV